MLKHGPFAMSATVLPVFRFHPDPLLSGSVHPSDRSCRCCRKKRGFIYTGPVYAEKDLDDALCPWCVADGSAHQKYDALFVDTEAFVEGTDPALIDEIAQRTPGFSSFQQERWLSCCGQPACYVEPAGSPEIKSKYLRAEGDLMGYIVYELGISGGAARRLLENLNRERGPTAHIFRCARCERYFGYVDLV